MRLTMLFALGCLTLSAQTLQKPTEGQTVFRSGTLLIPVDVRVLDSKGQPVKDLSAKDFKVYEDGKLQDIRQFSAAGLTPAAPDPTIPPGACTALFRSEC